METLISLPFAETMVRSTLWLPNSWNGLTGGFSAGRKVMGEAFPTWRTSKSKREKRSLKNAGRHNLSCV